MEPITRQEQLLDSIATGNSVELEPITREEQYLSAIAGSTDLIPEKPITRKEMFYEKILESGGVGGDGTAKPTQTKTIEVVENGTYKVTPDSGKVLSSVTANVNVPERYDEGFLQGFAEGKQQGRTEGYSSGYDAGVDSVKLQEKTATENGDVLPDEGFNGMKKVTVAVPTGSGKEEQEKSVTITENGTTEVTPDEGKTLSKVTVETNVSGDSVSLGYTLNDDGTYTPINAEKDTTVPMGSDWLVKLVFVSDKTYTVDEMLGHSIRKMKLTRKALYLESIQEVEITADSVMPIEDGWTIIDSSVGIPLICVITESIAGKDVGFGFPLPSNVGTYLTYADTKPDRQDNVIASISVKKAIRKPYIDTSMLEYFVGFFQYNHLLVNFINNLDVSYGTNFKTMFQGTGIENIPPLNTIRGTSFDFMFYSSGVKEIQSLNLSNLQTGSSMFSNCSKLETINIVGETTNINANYALEFPDSS
ncbi:MAG: BspA family leucine-rich repeat surface protein, partial [Bacteroidales bacterium]|nr:BspA family leucine-rich repeat surface protein [Bacteroidales bacterium]